MLQPRQQVPGGGRRGQDYQAVGHPGVLSSYCSYGLLELYQGISNNPGDNVAHFAHLGGMLFGFILIKYWNKTRRDTFY